MCICSFKPEKIHAVRTSSNVGLRKEHIPDSFRSIVSRVPPKMIYQNKKRPANWEFQNGRTPKEFDPTVSGGFMHASGVLRRPAEPRP